MNLPRRQFFHLAAGAFAAPAIARRAFADAYPSRPVRLVVGFTPAGGNDIIARLMGQWLTERLGQTFVIENRPGAGTNIAAEFVINSPPDGYTLFVTNLSNAINTTLYEKLNFDFMRDMLPVAGIAQAPAVFAINSSVPAKTVTEFIAHAKANPGRINMGSAGIGSTGHLAGELFKMMAGVNMVHVPYRGNAPALTDLIAGQIEVVFPSLGSSIEFLKAGRLRALAVTDATRSNALPDVPTMAELGYANFEVAPWCGLAAPAGTPDAVVARWNELVNEALRDPKLREQISALDYEVRGGTAPQFADFVAVDITRYKKLAEDMGLTED